MPNKKRSFFQGIGAKSKTPLTLVFTKTSWVFRGQVFLRQTQLVFIEVTLIVFANLVFASLNLLRYPKIYLCSYCVLPILFLISLVLFLKKMFFFRNKTSEANAKTQFFSDATQTAKLNQKSQKKKRNFFRLFCWPNSEDTHNAVNLCTKHIYYILQTPALFKEKC